MSTVDEIVAYLQALPSGSGDLQVILSKDGEGNGFSPWCGDHSIGTYEADNSYSGEFSEYDDPDEASNAIVLWPVN